MVLPVDNQVKTISEFGCQIPSKNIPPTMPASTQKIEKTTKPILASKKAHAMQPFLVEINTIVTCRFIMKESYISIKNERVLFLP